MNVLIDTNIVLDVLLRREPYFEDGARICVLSERGYIYGYVSATAVTDIFYIVNKELKNKDIVMEMIKEILKTVHIAAVTESNIHEALDLKWDDFEDSVQYIAGQNILAEYIITRNPKDYADSQIKAILPGEFLSRIAS